MATMRLIVLLAALTCVATISYEASSFQEGWAIPAFSRQYNFACTDCHVGASSKLNDFGQLFRDQGYQLPPEHSKCKAATTYADTLQSFSPHLLYKKFCLACHGPQGKGDGPMGEALRPRAADLTGQETRGKSDADLLKIIRDGTANAVMPAFKRQLTRQQLQELVAYIRSLSE